MTQLYMHRIVNWKNDTPASLALPEERLGGVDGSVSGVHGPVEEERPLGFSLPLDEVQTFLRRQPGKPVKPVQVQVEGQGQLYCQMYSM